MNSTPATAVSIYPIESDTTGFKDVLSEYQQFVYGERDPFDNPAAQRLDASQLLLDANHEVRVFFLDEGAGKRNDLFYSTTGPTTQNGTVFEDISCKAGCAISETDGNVNIGDWVNLGNFQAGTLFDFTLGAINRTDGQTDLYRTQPSLNPDGLDHIVAYEYKDRVVIGFEDLFGPLGATGGRNEGSDRDFNDTVFVVDMPVTQSTSVPEPTSILGTAIVSIFGIIYHRKRHLRVNPTFANSSPHSQVPSPQKG
ncbi:MAG: DUF4114 domain-containing protein [Leptolyngbyaceae cyanobacterium]